MSIKSFFKKISEFLTKNVYNSDWKCLNCGDEVYDGKKFCDKCFEILPFNDQYICEHCGRQVKAAEKYCTTCKGNLTAIDRGRSYFVYDKPINTLIQRFKYGNHRYLADYFTDCLKFVYSKNYFNADFFVYIPMTEKAVRKRGYNQSMLLAEKLSIKTEVPVNHCLKKVKETKRQATLKRSERMKNLVDAVRVIDKKSVKDKTVVIIDDVTTTGATAQAVAERLKQAGAKFVYLITVASTPPIEKY